MALGINGLGITGTLDNGLNAMNGAISQADANKFSNLVKRMENQTALDLANDSSATISSSQIAKNHRLNGDYTTGFYGTFTAEKDKNAAPQGIARNAGKNVTIDKTSDLYAQSMEMENYLMKIMLSSMRNTISHTSLAGEENEYARKMYEDMLYDNLAETMTKNSSTGIADQIYIELSRAANAYGIEPSTI